MLKPLLSVISATLAIASVAQAQVNEAMLLPAQAKPVASFEHMFRYRPACRDLRSRSSDTNGWQSWGLHLPRQYGGGWLQLYGLPSSLSQSEAWQYLDEYGLCTRNGISIALKDAWVGELLEESSEVSEASATEGATYPDVTLVIIGILGVSAVAAYKSESQKFSSNEPVVTPVTDNAGSLPVTVEIPDFAPRLPVMATPSDHLGVYSFDKLLAERLRPTLITANPRLGKGITLQAAGREAKRQHEGCTVWVLQPKYHPNEHAYWSDCDRICGFMAESLLGPEDKKPWEERMTAFILEWRQHQRTGKTVLVIDELSMLAKVFPKWFKDVLVPALTVEFSSGETSGRALWACTQSALCGDLGISGGNRSTFDIFTIQSPDSREHYESLLKSFNSIPRYSEALFDVSESPKQAIGYHSDLNEWHGLPRYDVPVSASVQGTQFQGAEILETFETVKTADFRLVSGVSETGEISETNISDLDPLVIQQVLKLIKDKEKQTDIIKTVWDCTPGASEAYRVAKQQFDLIKENFT